MPGNTGTRPKLQLRPEHWSAIALALLLFRASERPVHACALCGCDEFHACPGGCAWAWLDEDAGVGICSACARDKPREAREFFGSLEVAHG